MNTDASREDIPGVSYVHGTAVEEQQRLRDLNTLTNQNFIDFLGLGGDEAICDFGCGLGLLDEQISQQFPRVRLVGIERDVGYQLQAKDRNRLHAGVTILQGDVLTNKQPSEEFDLCFCRYFLEHVSDPKLAAQEMVRLTRPGGRIIVQENDLHNVLYYPEFPGHREVFEKFCELQLLGGGDPYIGRKLFELFDCDEIDSIELEMSPEIYTARDPQRYRAWLGNSIRILRGARSDLIQRGFLSETAIDRVLAFMDDRKQKPEGVALFYWNRLLAHKKS